MSSRNMYERYSMRRECGSIMSVYVPGMERTEKEIREILGGSESDV